MKKRRQFAPEFVDSLEERGAWDRPDVGAIPRPSDSSILSKNGGRGIAPTSGRFLT
jgi:hypothetical protein